MKKSGLIIGIVIAVIVIILAVMLLGGGGGEKNEKWGYTVKVPGGYEVKGVDDAWWIVKPGDKPEPQLSIVAKQGGDPNVVEDFTTTISSQEDVTINGVAGKLFKVKYSFYPDKECPVYKLVNEGVVYTIEPNECMDSPIFEKVVKSFKF